MIDVEHEVVDIEQNRHAAGLRTPDQASDRSVVLRSADDQRVGAIHEMVHAVEIAPVEPRGGDPELRRSGERLDHVEDAVPEGAGVGALVEVGDPPRARRKSGDTVLEALGPRVAIGDGADPGGPEHFSPQRRPRRVREELLQHRF